jgi:ribosomal protein S11
MRLNDLIKDTKKTLKNELYCDYLDKNTKKKSINIKNERELYVKYYNKIKALENTSFIYKPLSDLKKKIINISLETEKAYKEEIQNQVFFKKGIFEKHSKRLKDKSQILVEEFKLYLDNKEIMLELNFNEDIVINYLKENEESFSEDILSNKNKFIEHFKSFYTYNKNIVLEDKTPMFEDVKKKEYKYIYILFAPTNNVFLIIINAEGKILLKKNLGEFGLRKTKKNAKYTVKILAGKLKQIFKYYRFKYPHLIIKGNNILKRKVMRSLLFYFKDLSKNRQKTKVKNRIKKIRKYRSGYSFLRTEFWHPFKSYTLQQNRPHNGCRRPKKRRI